MVVRGYDDQTGVSTIELTATDAGPNGRIHWAATGDVSAKSPVVPDLIIERDETVLWFLAVDPDGKHETGEPVKWTNTLTLTYEPKEVMGKRTVALTVKPRGKVRWNTDGTNAREGKPYVGPIAIEGDGEVKVYTYAEDAGVETSKIFTIRPVKAGAIQLDPDKPVVIKKRQKIASTIDVFSTLKALKVAHAKLKGSLAVTVGQGELNATTRFGPQVVLAPDTLEAVLSLGRTALGNDTAEAEMGFAEVHFETGREMEEFVKTVGWAVGPDEVEQS